MDGDNPVDTWPGHGNTRGSGPWTAHSRLDQERQSTDSRSMHGTMALRQNSAFVTNLSGLPTRRQKPAWRVALSTFQQHHHVLPRSMCLRQVMCPSWFPFSQMKNLGMTIELETKGDKITCPAFGLYSSPAEHSTMGHIVLDLTSLAEQPTTKSREQLGHPKRQVTFSMSEQNQQIRLMLQTCMKMKMKMTNLLYVQRQERNRSKKDVIKPLMTKTLHLWFLRGLRDLLRPHSDRREKGPPIWQEPIAILEQQVSKDSREREKVRM